MGLATTHRTSINLVYVLARLESLGEREGATYRGLTFALGLSSRTGVISAVNIALSEGLVTKRFIGRGRRRKVVVSLTDVGRSLVENVR